MCPIALRVLDDWRWGQTEHAFWLEGERDDDLDDVPGELEW